MATPLDNRVVVLGVTGGIAAYKAVELLRRLRELGADVHVAMTRAATSFVGPLTFEALSGHRVFSDVLDLDAGGAAGVQIGHVALAQTASAVVVAPATADFLARAAAGRADDALGALLLATRAPLVIAPAMEHHMWSHPATRANVQTLVERGARLVEPDEGALASGATGRGRLAAIEAIVGAVLEALGGKRDLVGRRLVVTSGPTREPIDPVRYISNRSSGRMGAAIAELAAQRGARVTLISGPVSAPLPPLDAVIPVETAAEMHRATMDQARGADAVIMAAAVADYAPSAAAKRKLSKSEQPLDRIELVRTPDILAELGATRPARVIVGFAAETHEVLEHGRDKLLRKKADLIVANRVGTAESGFDSDDSEAVLLFADGRVKVLGLVSKEVVAARLLDAVAELLAGEPQRSRTQAPRARSKARG
ncbi:MAG: bifunctional phosphopantothenoylcysteine decarboxylase/phosphopantothenate--cysteine ligase CoaBC [Deltaproteobacteria bacterium]|nr:bifunctional phosphopantothenoylcysteine decarboxylase/phosphopantothenate--cysteine ligase CoaBC [Deltaproteobacteria bacterium]